MPHVLTACLRILQYGHMQQIPERLVLDPNNSILKEALSKELDELHRQLGTPRMRELSNDVKLELYTHLYAEFLILRLLTLGNVGFDQLQAEFKNIEGYNEFRALDANEEVQLLLQGIRRKRV